MPSRHQRKRASRSCGRDLLSSALVVFACLGLLGCALLVDSRLRAVLISAVVENRPIVTVDSVLDAFPENGNEWINVQTLLKHPRLRGSTFQSLTGVLNSRAGRLLFEIQDRGAIIKRRKQLGVEIDVHGSRKTGWARASDLAIDEDQIKRIVAESPNLFELKSIQLPKQVRIVKAGEGGAWRRDLFDFQCEENRGHDQSRCELECKDASTAAGGRVACRNAMRVCAKAKYPQCAVVQLLGTGTRAVLKAKRKKGKIKLV